MNLYSKTFYILNFQKKKKSQSNLINSLELIRIGGRWRWRRLIEQVESHWQ